MEAKEWIISEEGKITERVVRERELDAEEKVLEALTANVFRKIRNVLEIPDWGQVHACVGPMDTIWTIPINRIPLKAKFRLVNQVLVPMFDSATDVEMPMVWRAPAEVRLMFVIRTEPIEGEVSVDKNWLFAFSKAGNAYRLPLPNLYDECSICTGAFEDCYSTAAGCLQASLEQFSKSQWNADLLPTVEKSQKFFRFRPTDESFETLAIDAADWTQLCDKVSTAIMDRIIL